MVSGHGGCSPDPPRGAADRDRRGRSGGGAPQAGGAGAAGGDGSAASGPGSAESGPGSDPAEEPPAPVEEPPAQPAQETALAPRLEEEDPPPEAAPEAESSVTEIVDDLLAPGQAEDRIEDATVVEDAPTDDDR